MSLICPKSSVHIGAYLAIVWLVFYPPGHLDLEHLRKAIPYVDTFTQAPIVDCLHTSRADVQLRVLDKSPPRRERVMVDERVYVGVQPGEGGPEATSARRRSFAGARSDGLQGQQDSPNAGFPELRLGEKADAKVLQREVFLRTVFLLEPAYDLVLQLGASNDRCGKQRGFTYHAGEVDDSDDLSMFPAIGNPITRIDPVREVSCEMFLEIRQRICVQGRYLVLASEADGSGYKMV